MSSGPIFVGPLLQLRTVPAFASLPQPALADLVTDSEEVAVPRGGRLLEAGVTPEAFHLLVDGRVAGPHGRVATPGEMVGFLEVLAGTAPSAAAVAETHVVALRLDGDGYRTAAERHFAIIQDLLSHLAGTIAGLPGVHRAALAGRDARAEEAVPPEPLDRVGRILALHRCPAFPSRVMDALAELAGLAQEERTEPGRSLWRKGSPADAFQVVYAGSVLLEGFGDGEPARLGPGSLPGLIPALTGMPHALSARAETPVVGVRIDVDTFLDVLDDHFEMASGLVAHLAACLLRRELP